MRRSHVLCSIGGMAALLAVVAVCHGYPQPAPKPTIPSDDRPPYNPSAAPVEKPTAPPTPKPPLRPPVPHPDLTPWAPPTKPATAPSCGTVADCPPPGYRFPTAPVARVGTVYDLVERVEALKAKREAIEQELRETQALLREKFKALQEIVGQASEAGPPAAVGQTQKYYEPVTTYQTVLVKDPVSGATQRVVKAVTSYVLREVNVPAPMPPAPVPPTATCDPSAPAAPSAYDAGPPDNPKGKAGRPERGPEPAAPKAPAPVTPKAVPSY